MPIDPNEWWICEAQGILMQGPGFCFTNLIDVRDGKLIVRNGTDPDNPAEIPLDKLREFIDKHEKGLLPIEPGFGPLNYFQNRHPRVVDFQGRTT